MLPLFRGALYLESERCPAYPASRIWERHWPAQRLVGAREAALLNKCQTASGASYYVFLGARLEPHSGQDFQLRVAIPEDASFAEDLIGVIPGDLPEPLPRAVLTLDRSRYHPVDTRVWALRLAVSQLLKLLISARDWPPANPLLEELSQEWRSGKDGQSGGDGVG